MENKYGFNAYDTIIALALTQYLKGRNYKTELGKVIGTGDVNGAVLADLLDRATEWAKSGFINLSNPMMDQVKKAASDALTGFSGKRYVQSMDAGFCQFLDDYYHDRIK